MPRPPTSVTDEGLQKKSTLKDHGRENVNTPPCSTQRLSVYAQLRDEYSGRTPAAAVSNLVRLDCTLENSVVILDSTHKGIPNHDLLLGKAYWQDGLDEYDLDNESLGATLVYTAIRSVFEAVAGKWSDFIFSMSQHIITLEEEIYKQPANDERALVLWNVSKQLMKLHILLIENVQAELWTITIRRCRFKPKWLGQSLKDYRRLSSEVEETLKKPVAQMVDLVSFCCPIFASLIVKHPSWIYKSVSIRDARHSLELNTSM